MKTVFRKFSDFLGGKNVECWKRFSKKKSNKWNQTNLESELIKDIVKGEKWVREVINQTTHAYLSLLWLVVGGRSVMVWTSQNSRSTARTRSIQDLMHFLPLFRLFSQNQVERSQPTSSHIALTLEEARLEKKINIWHRRNLKGKLITLKTTKKNEGWARRSTDTKEQLLLQAHHLTIF